MFCEIERVEFLIVSIESIVYIYLIYSINFYFYKWKLLSEYGIGYFYIFIYFLLL